MIHIPLAEGAHGVDLFCEDLHIAIVLPPIGHKVDMISGYCNGIH